MAWLAIANHQTVTVRLTEGLMHQRRSHWVDRSSHECLGAECIYCKGGAKPRVRYFIAVQCAGQEYTWEFPATVEQQLVSALGGPDKILGGVVSVEREGEGLATRYRIVSVASGAVGSSVPAQLPGSMGTLGGDAGADVAGVLAIWQPTMVTAVSDAVWGLIMSAPFAAQLEQQCMVAVARVLTEAGVIEPEAPSDGREVTKENVPA